MSKEIQSVTITYHRSYNYGASLQAYALQNTLLSLGFKNSILDFYRDPYAALPLISGNLKRDLARLLLRFFEYKNKHEKEILIKAFDAFTENKLNLTQQYRTLKELKDNPPEADCFFSGSDQVFTLREPEFVVSRNLLTFIGGNCRKYSYAASLAHYDLTENEKNQLKVALSGFSTVSVRENRAAEFLKTFCECNFRVDVDPVFLLSKLEWENLMKRPKYGQKYILYFQVNANPIANRVLKLLKRQYNLPVVCIQTNPMVRVKADTIVLTASPEEFLGWIHNAEYVVTTSFHGTAFSILFNKEFITLTKASSNPIRIVNLLEVLGMSKRVISDEKEIYKQEPINWNEVSNKLNTLRSNSVNYLQNIYLELEKQTISH